LVFKRDSSTQFMPSILGFIADYSDLRSLSRLPAEALA